MREARFMSLLVRSPDDAHAHRYTTSELRYSVMLRARMEGDDLPEPVWIRVMNISSGGLMAQLPKGFEAFGAIVVTIGTLPIAGDIVWLRDNRIGVKFDDLIDPLALLETRTDRETSAAASRAAPPMPHREWLMRSTKDADQRTEIQVRS